MPAIKRSKIAPYTVTEMYALVDAIENYPQFVRWCQSSTIHSRTEHEVRATLCFASSGIHKCFTTCNRLQKDKMIEMRLVDGPFKHLQGYWRFDTVDVMHSKIMFDLEFEFSSRLLSFAFGPLFNQIANTLVESFCERAVTLYGKRE